MSTVRIPPVLRTATGGMKQVDVAGATVGEAVTALVAAYPALASRLLTADGSLNRFVNVYLNGTDIRHLQELATLLGDTDSLVLLPAMAGGASDESDGSLRAYGRVRALDEPPPIPHYSRHRE